MRPDASAAPPSPHPGSIVIDFRLRGPGDPVGVVIGPDHAPYYLLEDGRTEPASPAPAERPI